MNQEDTVKFKHMCEKLNEFYLLVISEVSHIETTQ